MNRDPSPPIPPIVQDYVRYVRLSRSSALSIKARAYNLIRARATFDAMTAAAQRQALRVAGPTDPNGTFVP